MYFQTLLKDRKCYKDDEYKDVIVEELKRNISSRVEIVLSCIDNYKDTDAQNVKMYVKDLIDNTFNDYLLKDLGLE